MNQTMVGVYAGSMLGSIAVIVWGAAFGQPMAFSNGLCMLMMILFLYIVHLWTTRVDY